MGRASYSGTTAIASRGPCCRARRHTITSSAAKGHRSHHRARVTHARLRWSVSRPRALGSHRPPDHPPRSSLPAARKTGRREYDHVSRYERQLWSGIGARVAYYAGHQSAPCSGYSHKTRRMPGAPTRSPRNRPASQPSVFIPRSPTLPSSDQDGAAPARLSFGSATLHLRREPSRAWTAERVLRGNADL